MRATLLPPAVPEGWSVNIEYRGDSGSMDIEYIDDVIDAADFRPLAKDLSVLPRARLRAHSDCFKVQVTVRERREGTASYGCSQGIWIYESAAPKWSEPECISDPPPRN